MNFWYFPVIAPPSIFLHHETNLESPFQHQGVIKKKQYFTVIAPPPQNVIK